VRRAKIGVVEEAWLRKYICKVAGFIAYKDSFTE
jgi:hypothetical protein